MNLLTRKRVLLKAKHWEMPIKRERIMKELVTCSVNEVQLMVHESGKNVQPLAFCLKHGFTQKGEGGKG